MKENTAIMNFDNVTDEELQKSMVVLLELMMLLP